MRRVGAPDGGGAVDPREGTGPDAALAYIGTVDADRVTRGDRGIVLNARDERHRRGQRVARTGRRHRDCDNGRDRNEWTLNELQANRIESDVHTNRKHERERRREDETPPCATAEQFGQHDAGRSAVRVRSIRYHAGTAIAVSRYAGVELNRTPSIQRIA